MVSIRKASLGFVFIPPLTSKSHIAPSEYRNHRNWVNRANLFSPISSIRGLFKDDTNSQLIEELENRALEIIQTSPASHPDSTINLSELNSEAKKVQFLNGLLLKWSAKGLALTIQKLFSFKRLVTFLGLTRETVYSAVDDLFNRTEERSNLDYLLVLKDLFKPFNPDFPVSYHHATYITENLDPVQVLSEAKSKLIMDEMGVVLDKDMAEYALANPPRPAKTNAELLDLKKNLADTFSTEVINLDKLSNADLSSLSLTMYKHFWEIDFYRNEASLEVPRPVMELLNVDAEFCDQICRDLIKSRMTEVRAVKIQRSLKMPEFVNRIAVFKRMLDAELAFARSEFNHWCRLARERVMSLKQRGFDPSKYEADLLPVKKVGGVRPFVNIKIVCPENPELVPDPEYESDSTEDEDEIPQEDPATIKANLEKVEEDLKIFAHLTMEQRSDFFMNKVPHEIEYARRVKKRRERILELNNPFNTEIDIPDKSLFSRVRRQEPEEQQKPLEITEKNVPAILTQIRTEFNRHLMNIKHLEWQLTSAENAPYEMLCKIFEDGQDITNPDPKKLKFAGSQFERAFNSLNEFKKSTTSEADRHRRHLFHSGTELTQEKKERELETSTTPLFGDDPDFLQRDDKLVDALVESGAGFNIAFTFPYIDIPIKPTEKQKESTFYRMTVSQPKPIYRCTKCDYRIFSGYVETYEGGRVMPTEYNAFKKDPDYRCRSCNADRSAFEETWTTGERRYEYPKYLKRREKEEDEYEF